jgi:hypothetical protein
MHERLLGLQDHHAQICIAYLFDAARYASVQYTLANMQTTTPQVHLRRVPRSNQFLLTIISGHASSIHMLDQWLLIVTAASKPADISSATTTDTDASVNLFTDLDTASVSLACPQPPFDRPARAPL